ncbi:MAG: three-Cys-motif partner protein TcmP [Bryobacterales bacterium]|nr:three-Cys-motif partner protein TcmP [Bryobacterales bacterium]
MPFEHECFADNRAGNGEVARPYVRIAEQATRFGGNWTVEKLDILERYLDAYTTALKDRPFKLVYIDAFAGSGQVRLGNVGPDASALISGSAERAARINSKPFDRLYFVEMNSESCRDLESLKTRHRDRDIRIENSDANTFICGLQMDWKSWRGVIFLDPFATQVYWSTIERISQFKALDMWILFPTSAIARMLPTSRTPDDIHPGWATRLTQVYGDESWRRLYEPTRQLSLFGSQGHERESGVDGLVRIYREKLATTFGSRFMSMSRPLLISTGSRIFELLFCVGNRRGICPAKNIANHILNHF